MKKTERRSKDDAREGDREEAIEERKTGERRGHRRRQGREGKKTQDDAR